jgi:hypothetical protein
MSKEDSPWASGPGEILRHGLDLLKKDTDTNRRLAMISIDNAVELTVKTHFELVTIGKIQNLFSRLNAC